MIPPVNIAFMQAAGIEKITATYEGLSDTAFVKNQADWFYYSGHALHSLERMMMGDTSFSFGPPEANTHWNEDLQIVILATCSMIDVNDYLGYFDDDGDGTPEVGPVSKIFPGEKLANTGPKYLLGYNAKSPGKGMDTIIINEWLGSYPALGITKAWLKVNADHDAVYASAIDERGYWYLIPYLLAVTLAH
ncbi:MAG: hypothetical protein QME40_07760 [bacterium]|nr:hypothetical protein [bacterium]